MKKYLITVILISAFVLGIINGVTQKQSIVIDNASYLFDSEGNICGVGKKEGFVNTKKIPIISRNHLIYLAKKELSKEDWERRKLIFVEYNEDCDLWEISFTSRAFKEDYENTDPMTIFIDDYAMCVFLDKNGVTRYVE